MTYLANHLTPQQLKMLAAKLDESFSDLEYNWANDQIKITGIEEPNTYREISDLCIAISRIKFDARTNMACGFCTHACKGYPYDGSRVYCSKYSFGELPVTFFCAGFEESKNNRGE